MGTLIGGVYAAGKLEEFRNWMKTIDRKKMLELTDFSLSLNHLVKGKRIIEAIMEFVPAIRASISLPSFYEPVQRDGMILIDGGVINPIPLNRVKRHPGDLLVGVDVSGHDYREEWARQHEAAERQKLMRDKSLKTKILDMLIPDNIDFNYYTVLSRTSSLMIRQNSILMAQLMKPDMLIDIQMSRYGSFDYDKSEKIIALGRNKTRKLLSSSATMT